MNDTPKVLDPKLQQLVDRVSAMTAHQFNVCLEAYGQYQEEWNDYREEQSEAESEAEDAGEEWDEDAAQEAEDAFTDALGERIHQELLQNHPDITEAMYDGVAELDEAVYQGEVDWSMIRGKGKNLDLAGSITRRG